MAFPTAAIKDDDPLPQSLKRIYFATGEQFVIIFDEYDVLVREKVPQAVLASYLRFLNGMFKNADLAPAIALAYLTGILPIVRDKVQSKLNLFNEFSMLVAGPFAGCVGFTNDEVQALCKEYHLDFDECKRWYDGYILNGIEVYNSNSVVKALQRQEFSNYWNQTGSFDALRSFILMNFEGILDDVNFLNPEIDYGTMTDKRDCKVYRTVKIGNQTWMAENLNFTDTAASIRYYNWCYGNKEGNCDVTGRLYSWAAAMDSTAIFSENGKGCGNGNTDCSIIEPVRGICPEGWHLPSESEFSELIKAVGEYSVAGTQLKSASDWKESDGILNGTNSSGFSAIPAGQMINDMYYTGKGEETCFWTSHNQHGNGGQFPVFTPCVKRHLSERRFFISFLF